MFSFRAKNWTSNVHHFWGVGRKSHKAKVFLKPSEKLRKNARNLPIIASIRKKKKKHGGVPGPLFSHTSSGPFFVGKKLGGCLPIKKSSPGGNSSSSPSLYTWQYLWPRDFFVGDLDLDASFDDDTFSPGSEKGEIQFVG